jgi:hypothetical protein
MDMSSAGTTDARAARKAWRALPRETRVAVFTAALKGKRPPTDAATWPIVLDWARLYPGRSVANGLMGASFLVLALGFPDIYGAFNWVVIAWASFVLCSVVVMNVVTARIRRLIGPRPETPVAPAAPGRPIQP